MRAGAVAFGLVLLLSPSVLSAASPDCDRVNAGAWNGTHGLASIVKIPGAALHLGLGQFRFAGDETISVSVQIDNAGLAMGVFAFPYVPPSAFSFHEGPHDPLAVALGVDQEPTQLAGMTTTELNLSAVFRIGEQGGVPAGQVVYPVLRVFEFKEPFLESEGQRIYLREYQTKVPSKVRLTASCTGPAQPAAAATAPLTPANIADVTAPRPDAALSPLKALTVQTNARSVRAGKALTATARAEPSSATGTVTFLAAGQTLCADVRLVRGVARCKTSFAKEGEHQITARYSGDASFAGSTSPATALKVVKKR
jgi:hypothetical protein